MKKVSVIIPVYNGDKFIENILKQLSNETHDNLEVVFVDDGSKDDSGKILDRVKSEQGAIIEPNTENRCTRIFGNIKNIIVVHQDNSGQGGARNRGIIEATGEYILFMDQDDRIKPDYIEKLYDVAENTGCDMVISGYEHVSTNGEVKEHVELVNNEWCRFMNITPWGKIYRRSFVEEENIKFLPVSLGEDIYFNVLCYSHARNVAYTDYVGYQWVINESSVSNTVHRKLSDESNILILFNELIKMDTANNWIRDEQFRYFFIKTGIFHVLYAAKGTDSKALLEYNRDVFSWLTDHLGNTDNSLIAWNTPSGERANVRHVVYIFMKLRKLHLDRIFLRAFSGVSKLLP